MAESCRPLIYKRKEAYDSAGFWQGPHWVMDCEEHSESQHFFYWTSALQFALLHRRGIRA